MRARLKPDSQKESNTTASMPLANLWMLEGCVGTSMDAAHNQDEWCSKTTQASINTCAIGTQCNFRLLTCASSQTEQEFPGLSASNVEAGASKKCLSQYATDIEAEGGLRTCSCYSHFGCTRNIGGRNSPKGTEEIQFGGKPYFSVSC